MEHSDLDFTNCEGETEDVKAESEHVNCEQLLIDQRNSQIIHLTLCDMVIVGLLTLHPQEIKDGAESGDTKTADAD